MTLFLSTLSVFASVQPTTGDIVGKFTIDPANSFDPSEMLDTVLLNIISLLSDDEMSSIVETIAEDITIRLNSIDTLRAYFNDIAFLQNYEVFHQDDYQTSLFFNAAAYVYLDTISETYETALQEGSIDKESPESLYLSNRLWDFQYGVEMPICNVCKLKSYIKEGRWSYIWMKFTSTYLKEFLIACSIAFACLVLFITLIYKKSKSCRSYVNRCARRLNIQNYLINKKLKSMGITNIHKIATLLLIALITSFSSDLFANGFKSHCELLTLSEKIDRQHRKVKNFYSLNSSQLGNISSFEKHLARSKNPYSSYGLAKPYSFIDRTRCSDFFIDSEGFNKYEEILHQLNSMLTDKTVTGLNEKKRKEVPIKKTTASKSKNELFLTKMKTQGYYASNIKHKKQNYSYVIVDMNSDSIQFELYLDSLPDETFTFKKVIKENVKMVLNAGMYRPDYSPEGLLVINGNELSPLNLDPPKKKWTNFYSLPSGVFFCDSLNHCQIVTKEEYAKQTSDLNIKYATQSGPVLLQNGKIINDKSGKPILSKNSNSRYTRNGVGILKDGRLVFLISEESVTFYDFAMVFKEYFKCNEALYLDGAISRMYAPELQKTNTDGHFGPLVTISSLRTN